jgi:hypothetical protein
MAPTVNHLDGASGDSVAEKSILNSGGRNWGLP